MTTPIDATGDKSSAEIEQEIQQTRNQVARDIDALTDKLKPANLAAGASGSIRGAGEAAVRAAEEFVSGAGQRVSGYGTRVMDLIEEHPVPVALAAAGLVWMVTRPGRDDDMDMRRLGRAADEPTAQSGAYGTGDAMSYVDEQGGMSGGLSTEGGISGGASGSQGRSGYGSGYETSGTYGAAGVSGGQGSGGGLRSRVDDFASRAKGRTAQWKDRGREVTQRTQQRAQGFFESNPLGAALAVFAAGLALGFAIPVTDAERRTLGPARDRLLDEAREITDEAKGIARSAFEEAKGAVQQETSARGDRLNQVVSDLKTEVGGVARRAADAATETARREAQSRELIG